MTSARALAVLLTLAASAAAYEAPSESELAKLLRKAHKAGKTPLERMDKISERFLGAPYKLGPLGEGPDGEFDRDPLMSFERFDCTTFVETVMAHALEPEPAKAAKTLQSIRYKEGKVGFVSRNHFPEADWIPQNIWAGYLRDVTAEVAGDKAVQVGKTISKRDWYLSMSTANVEGKFTEEDRAARAAKLKTLGAVFEDQRAVLTILPLDALPAALKKIRSGTIASLVRADLPDKPVVVTHQVLLIQKGKKKDAAWFVRHAAFGKAVEDVPALEYFYRFYNAKWPVLGLNLVELRDPRDPHASGPR